MVVEDRHTHTFGFGFWLYYPCRFQSNKLTKSINRSINDYTRALCSLTYLYSCATTQSASAAFLRYVSPFSLATATALFLSVSLSLRVYVFGKVGAFLGAIWMEDHTITSVPFTTPPPPSSRLLTSSGVHPLRRASCITATAPARAFDLFVVCFVGLMFVLYVCVRERERARPHFFSNPDSNPHTRRRGLFSALNSYYRQLISSGVDIPSSAVRIRCAKARLRSLWLTAMCTAALPSPPPCVAWTLGKPPGAPDRV